MKLRLKTLNPDLFIYRFAPEASIPAWATSGSFFSITRQDDELSIVCEKAKSLDGVPVEGPWRALKVLGPLDFSLTGILASLTQPLAEAELSIFAISTFDTDFLLVRAHDLDAAVHELVSVGFEVET